MKFHMHCICISLLGISQAITNCNSQVTQFTLDNGIRVIVNPVDEASDVGVETVYEVGFIDEPESMVQSSHLLEHLVCYAPGAGYEQKDAMKWLNSIGMANAETLPDWTHYDYAVPADELESVLKIEAARLQQATFDPDLIRTEALRVYQETDFVENNPAAGMLKHAFMALAHSWKYNSSSALVRGGLDDMDPVKLHQFYQQTYRPANLTIAITGKTTPEQVRELIVKHLGSIKNPDLEKQESKVDWRSVAEQVTVKWDSEHSAVCVFWNPPADKKQQVYLSTLGTLAIQELMNDKTIKHKCHSVFCTNTMWFAEDLPLFVYAMAKNRESLDDIEQLIGDKLEEAFQTAIQTRMMMFNSLAVNYEFQQKPTSWARVQQASKFLANPNRSRSQALQMVLVQDALTRVQTQRFLGEDAQAMIDNLKSAKPAELEALVNEVLKPENRHIVHLVPQ